MTFPEAAPAAAPVFFRTYSRRSTDGRESWPDVVNRNVAGLTELGRLTAVEAELIRARQNDLTALPSGRWLWVGGTRWLTSPKNFSGAYNCTSTDLSDVEAFALMMDLAMMGSGTGAIIEPRTIGQLPPVARRLTVANVSPIGAVPASERRPETLFDFSFAARTLRITVGDSRRGWVDAYHILLRFALLKDPVGAGAPDIDGDIRVIVDLGNVRPAGERLSGFGGVANPVKLPELFGRVAAILNGAVGRQLSSVECCLLIDEAAAVVVAGNVRRSAGMRQFAADDLEAAAAKDNLWGQDEDGHWKIDPERDALRMANHTRVFHSKPSRDVVLESVRKQFYSGEGAIQYAPEAIARANADLLGGRNSPRREEFLTTYATHGPAAARDYLGGFVFDMPAEELDHRMTRYGLNPCGEIIGRDFHCNLAEVHLNLLAGRSDDEIEDAFRAAALSVGALLHHEFEVPRYRESRELDPIVGVSFTGLFDFFVAEFGTAWLEWWEAGRPDSPEGRDLKRAEAALLDRWREVVEETLWGYCIRHGLRRPNRCTTVQPAGTKSLLTGASSGWHPPKAQRFIRRITFAKNDPVALACIDYGYSVIPGQGDKDDDGRLLSDPFDPRCTEWLVEIPTAVAWADVPGADQFDLSQFSALAQFDFYMQVQRHYTTHNTSATIEFRENEIEPLADAIHLAIVRDGGYISAALLARFDANETFPRLPFEPIDRETYDVLHAAVLARRTVDDFEVALARYDLTERTEAGPAGCDSDKCLLPSLRG